MILGKSYLGSTEIKKIYLGSDVVYEVSGVEYYPSTPNLIGDACRETMACFISPFDQNAGTAPDATNTALGWGASGNSANFVNISSFTPNVDYKYSIWLKQGLTNPSTHIRITTNNTFAWNTGVSTKYALTSEWVKHTYTGSLLLSGSTCKFIIGGVDETGGGDGDVSGEILVWGLHIEKV